jgi:hypothetical protein
MIAFRIGCVAFYIVLLAGGLLTLHVALDPTLQPTIDPVRVRLALILAGVVESSVGGWGLYLFTWGDAWRSYPKR